MNEKLQNIAEQVKRLNSLWNAYAYAEKTVMEYAHELISQHENKEYGGCSTFGAYETARDILQKKKYEIVSTT